MEHVLVMLAQRPVDSAQKKLIGTIREASRLGSKQNCPASLHLCAPRGLIGTSTKSGRV